MEDCDLEIVESTSTNVNEDENKPLMMLFKRLIGNDSKQNTVLTNAQIVDILQKEFNMDIIYTHALEIDIYLNILKKFLKDWPQWDDFDSDINVLKNQKDKEKMNEMLHSNYQSLKAYLQRTLKSVEPLLKETMKEVKEELKEQDVTEDEIVMQLQCTRQMLNQLFFRRPHPLIHNTIFKLPKPLPSKIKLSNLSIERMLNWYDIRVTINNGNLVMRREIILSLKHVLRNKKLDYAKEPPELLKPNFQTKGLRISSIVIDDIIDRINDLHDMKNLDDDLKNLVQTTCNLIKSDMEEGPQVIQFPAVYRRNVTKYPLRRFLYSEVETNIIKTVNNYDLQLEETATPQVYLYFVKIGKKYGPVPAVNLLEFFCTSCNWRMKTSTELQQHLEDFHQNEPDWHCTNCEATLPMEVLVSSRWTHDC